MLAASAIMTLAGRNLNDEGAVRWTLPELCDWINEAVKAILLAKPSAYSQPVVLNLQSGTLQSLLTAHLSLLRVTRNITATGSPPVGGRIIRPTTRDALDASSPYWHVSSSVPFQKEVRQYVYDEENPREFYVYPGNNGTGMIEALVSMLPTPVSAAVGSKNPTDVAAYAVDVGLTDLYQAPVLDYVLFRAFSKDDPAGNPAGATAHFQAFAAAIGMKTQVEASNSPNANPMAKGSQ
jgi:hypothetical protein